MANKIKGNHDGPNGENRTYTIPGRGVVSRPVLVREIKQGKHPDYSTVIVNDVEFVRAKPDGDRKNNVNPK